MTTGKLPERTQGLRDFTDALRAALGLQPIYRQKSSVYFTERFLPRSTVKTDEWFRAAPVVADETPTENAFRRRQDARAERQRRGWQFRE